MIKHEKPNRKGEIGAGKATEIYGRVDFSVEPERSGNVHVWTVNNDETIAVSMDTHVMGKPQLLVLSLPRTTAWWLLDELKKTMESTIKEA